VVSSDLLRASSTAQAVCEHVGLPLILDARLRETYFGEWQGLTGDEVAAGWPVEFEAWRRHEGHPVGGETPAEVGADARSERNVRRAGILDDLVFFIDNSGFC